MNVKKTLSSNLPLWFWFHASHVYTTCIYLYILPKGHKDINKINWAVEKMWVNLICYCFLLLECTDSKNPYTYIKSNTKLRKCC